MNEWIREWMSETENYELLSKQVSKLSLFLWGRQVRRPHLRNNNVYKETVLVVGKRKPGDVLWYRPKNISHFIFKLQTKTSLRPQLHILYLLASANSSPRGGLSGIWVSNKSGQTERHAGQRLCRVKILSPVLFRLVWPSGPIKSLVRAL